MPQNTYLLEGILSNLEVPMYIQNVWSNYEPFLYGH